MTEAVIEQPDRTIRALTARSERNHARLYANHAQEWTTTLGTFEAPESLAKLDRHFGNILLAFRRAADPQQVNQPEIVRVIALCMYDYFDLRGKWDDWIRTAPQGLQACETLGDDYSLGVAYPSICNTLGIALRMLGRSDDAMQWFQRALQQAANDHVRADTLTNMADIHRLTGHPEDACACAKAAVALAQQHHDREREAKGQEYLGLSLVSLRDYTAAMSAYDQALELRRASGNLRRLALALTFKAYALTMRGEPADLNAAERCYDEARVIDMRLKNEQSLARYQGDIAALYNRSGQYEKAIEYGTEALSVNKRIGFRRGIALNFVRLVESYLQLGQLNNALSAAEQGFSLQRELTDFDLRMTVFEHVLGRLAHALARDAQLDEAGRVAAMALEVGDRTDNGQRLRSEIGFLLSAPRPDQQLTISGEEIDK